MAFPAVASSTTSVTTPAAVDHDISLPSGVALGDLLLLIWAPDGGDPGTWPAGWNEVVAGDLPSFVGRIECRYKIATSTEVSASTIRVTGSDPAVTSSHTAYRITGHNSTAPATSTLASGNSANGDPGACAPSWGAKDTLWITAVAVDNTSVTAAPTNYTDLLATTTPSRLGSARRENNTSSEDPGTFTHGSDQWAAFTVGIEPTAVASSTPPAGAVVLTGAAPAQNLGIAVPSAVRLGS